MMRAVYVMYCTLALLWAGQASAQCIDYLFDQNVGSLIGLNVGSGVSSSDVGDAIDMWNECNSYATGFPAFGIGEQGDINITVKFVNGRNPLVNSGCGLFTPTKTGNLVTGGVITIYAQPGQNASFSSCSATFSETIAHELGHVLGLDDSSSSCTGYIMSPNTGQAGTREVKGSECGAAAIGWDTWEELGEDDPNGPYQQSNFCPLILDLNGDGIQTTNLFDPVAFTDPEGNGTLNRGGWTRADTEEAFVWVDLDRDHSVEYGELLGTAFPLPDGTTARNGFQVLQVYDCPEYGGNGDGLMTKRDALFGKLLLWVDRNHDGKSQRGEVTTVKQSSIVSIRTSFEHVHQSDGNGNIVMLRSSYTARHGNVVQERTAEDIGFIVRKE